MTTPNDDLTSGCGLDKTCHDPRDAYDSKHGKYVNDVPAPIDIPPSPDTNPSPFGSLK